jgi:hypothetical protein
MNEYDVASSRYGEKEICEGSYGEEGMLYCLQNVGIIA